ncbi:MAG: tetratricopeptide repeat protein [Vampirovibrionales bacterium]
MPRFGLHPHPFGHCYSIFFRLLQGLSTTVLLFLIQSNLISLAAVGLSTPIHQAPTEALAQSPWGQLALASRAVQQQQPMAALQPLYQATEVDPKNVLAHYLLADVAAQLGHQATDATQKTYWHTLAGDYYEKTICLNPGVLSATLKLGKLALENQDYPAAENHYRNALRLLPENAALHYNLANVYDEQDRYPEAIAEYQQTVALDPDFLYAYNNLGLLYEVTNQPEKAQQAFEAALARNPRYNFARLNLGQLFMKQDRLNQAEQLFAEVLRYEPDNAWAYVYLGNLQVQRRQYNQAALAYRQAIEHQPDYSPTYYLMAAVLEKLGRWGESAQYGETYLTKAPQGLYATQARQLIVFAKIQEQTQEKLPEALPVSSATPTADTPPAGAVVRGYVQNP